MRRSTRVNFAAIRTAAAYALGYAAFTAINLTHAVIRGNADHSAATSYSAGPIEHAVFHGWPTLWLQRWTPQHHFFMDVAFLIWASIFYVPLILCAVALATSGARGLASLIALHAVLVLSADVLFALGPTRPPWMDLPIQRSITTYSGFVLSDSNTLAAVPSLHIAVPVAYALWFRAQHDHRLRVLGCAIAAWSFAMAWSVVFTGEHYVFGAAAGMLWAAVVFVGLRTLGLVTDTAPATNATSAPPQPIPFPQPPAHQPATSDLRAA